MNSYDVFNGDADGICALLQLRLAQPKNSTLITGVKRDIKLLSQVKAQAGDDITVLDIALEKNLPALNNCLQAGASVHYYDHHNPGEIPSHPQLHCHINTDANTCTSLIVNESLQGRFVLWALVGAFGDNMEKTALSIAAKQNLTANEIDLLQQLGTYINYNGYGSTLDSLFFHPAELFKQLLPFANPLDFIRKNPSVYEKLEQSYHKDLELASSVTAYRSLDNSAVFMLPNEEWAKRVGGVFGNQLANDTPDRAHAILSELPDSNYLVSVRAPLTNKNGADEICLQFETGGGRKGAAGINQLPAAELNRFIETFENYYKKS